MKKSIYLMVLLLTTLLVMVFLPRPVKAQPTTIIAMDPAAITVQNPGDTFQVNATVDVGTRPLFLWTLSLSWDPSVLNLTAYPIEGPFVKNQTGVTTFIWVSIDLTGGSITELVCGSLDPSKYATGSGVIATFTFQALDIGDSALHLYGPPANPTKPVYIDYFGEEHLFDTVIDGSVTVVSEFPAFLIVPIFIIITLITVVITKKALIRRRREHLYV